MLSFDKFNYKNSSTYLKYW